MTTYEKQQLERKQKAEKIEEYIRTINNSYGRVLIRNCYEGYEWRKLKEALENLLYEVNNK